MAWAYRCALCRQVHSEASTDYCSACGAPVLAESLGRSGGPLAGPGRGIWRYAAHLPLRDDAAWLGLGDGGCRIVAAPDLAARLGVARVLLVLDHLGTTGSFKDRLAAAGVAHAVEHGARGVVCASSGNAAAAAAAYAARAGLPALVVVPEHTPTPKIALPQVFGASVLRVAGDYSHSFSVGRALCREFGYVNLSTTYVNPTAVAALRTVAFELAEGTASLVHHVVVPTGAGPLVHGVAAGYRYLVERGDVTRSPAVHAVQLNGCAPVVRAFRRGDSTVAPWNQVTTGVSGLDDPLRGYPDDGTVTLDELRGTGGMAVDVGDDDAYAAQHELAAEQGVFVEPAAATSIASLSALVAQGAFARDDVVACLLTGHGLKTLDPAAAEQRAPCVQTADEAARILRTSQ